MPLLLRYSTRRGVNDWALDNQAVSTDVDDKAGDDNNVDEDDEDDEDDDANMEGMRASSKGSPSVHTSPRSLNMCRRQGEPADSARIVTRPCTCFENLRASKRRGQPDCGSLNRMLDGDKNDEADEGDGDDDKDDDETWAGTVRYPQTKTSPF
jgi:hypothetical protein